MLIDHHAEIVQTIKISSSFKPNSYPHYFLLPIPTETGNKYCLFFYVSLSKYLILADGIQRYMAIKHLKRWLQTAPFEVFEVFYG